MFGTTTVNWALSAFFYDGWIGLGNAHSGTLKTGWLGLTWDQELITFLIGSLLMVAVPAGLVKCLLKMNLSDFGFSAPARGKSRAVMSQSVLLAAVTIPGFYLAAGFPSVWGHYPYYRGDPATLEFAAYEVAASLFYLSIEGMFRGFILFGVLHWLSSISRRESPIQEMKLASMAIILFILPYAVWHMNKSSVEMWGTIFWGLVAGASAISTKTIWHLVILHWLLNVFMDYLILFDT